MNRYLVLGVAVVAAVGLAGCESTKLFRGNPGEERAEGEDYVPSATPMTGVDLDAVWERSEQVLGQEGFAIDRERTSYADRVMCTHWEVLLAPNRFEGKRSRTWVNFSEAPGGGWTVGVAVQVQRNVDIDQPSSISQANWESTESNKGRANVILWKIEAALRPEAPGDADSK